MNTIQVMNTYKESFHNVRSHKIEWMRVAFGPILIWALGLLFIILAYIASGYTLDVNVLSNKKELVEEPSFLFIFANIVYHILYIVAVSSLYINGYRYALLNEGGGTWITLNLNMRLVKFFLYSILLTIFAVLYGGIAAGIIIGSYFLFGNTGIAVILGILLAVYGFYLLFRLVLFPVVISIDQGSPFKTSWNLMRGNILRFMGVMLLVALTIILITLLGGIVVALFGFLLGAINPILGIVIGMLLGITLIFFLTLLGWAVNSKVLALVYQELMPDAAA